MTKEMREILEELSSIETRSAEIRANAETAEDSAIDELTEEVQKLTARKQELTARKEAIEAEEAEARAVANGTVKAEPVKARGENKMTLAEIRASHEYNVAYAEYIKTNDDTEVRKLLTDMVEGGTVPVPLMVENVVGHAWEETVILRRLTKMSVPGIVDVPYEISATGAVEHAEGSAAPAEEELEIGTVELKPVMLKKWLTYSDEVEAMKGEAFLSYLNAEITQRIYEKGDAKAVAAMLNTGLKQSITAAIDFTTPFAAQAKLSDEAKNPVAVMTRDTYFNKIMTLADTTGRPIYNIVADNGKQTYYWNGMEVLFSSAAGTKIIVADLDALRVNLPDGDGIKFVRDPYSLAEADLIKVVGKLYMAVNVVKPGRVVVVTPAA